MKKVVSLLLAFVMSMGMITGCGSKDKMPEGEVTLSVGIPQLSTVTSYSDGNAFTEYLEEKSGVTIDFVFFSSSSSEYSQQLALMCSAQQELPDILLGFDLGHYVMNQYGEDGYFLELSDLIDKYGENYKVAIKKLKEEDAEVAEYASEKVVNTNDGGIYGMPRVVCTATDSMQSLMHINKNWLDNLGLQVPTTLEELRNVLHAFATKDPNGNGQNDEIPMIGGEGIRNYLINAFVYYQQGTFNVTDGKVWDPIYTDEFRQALIYGNKMVQDDLYNSMSFTVSSTSELKNLISPPEAASKVGVFVGLSTIMTNANSDAIGEFTVMPALADETGKGGYTIIAEQNVTWTGFVTKDCEYPEVAMKFIDLFYDDETVTRQRHGVEGVDWERYDGTNGSGSKSYTKQINSEAFFGGKQTWCGNMLGIMTHYNYLTVNEEPQTERIAQTQRLVKETWDIMHNAKEAEERCIYMVYTQDEYELREDKQGVVNSYINEQVTQFFSGQKNPADDAQWNEFLNTLKEIGREELMEVAQNAYDRK